MGNIILAASTTKSTGSSSDFYPIILIILVMFLIYWTMSRRSRARQAAQMNNTMMPGQYVRTTSGMYGTVSSVEGDDVMVEVHPGVHIRMMKRAVVPVADGGPGANGTGTTTTTTAADTADPASANGSGPDHEASDDEADAEDWNPKDRNL